MRSVIAVGDQSSTRAGCARSAPSVTWAFAGTNPRIAGEVASAGTPGAPSALRAGRLAIGLARPVMRCVPRSITSSPGAPWSGSARYSRGVRSTVGIARPAASAEIAMNPSAARRSAGATNGVARLTSARGTARTPSRIAAPISSRVTSSSAPCGCAARLNATAVDSRSDRLDARSIRRAMRSSSIRRAAASTAPRTTTPAAPISSARPVERAISSTRIAKITASAAAAATMAAVVAPSSAHWPRIRRRARLITPWIAWVSRGDRCGAPAPCWVNSPRSSVACTVGSLRAGPPGAQQSSNG